MCLCLTLTISFFYFIFFFFFNDTATTEIYTLSLHDALPSCRGASARAARAASRSRGRRGYSPAGGALVRSEEHTSELQSHSDLVCRLLLEKKKKKIRKLNLETNNKKTASIT